MEHPQQELPESTRRRFLKRVTSWGSAIIAVLVGLPAIRSFFSPAFRPPPTVRWVKLGEAEQIEPGIPIRFDFTEEIDDAWVQDRAMRGVWVYTEDQVEFTVYNGLCTHLGCSYSFDEAKERFQCGCHHGLFDIATGSVIDGPPPRALDTLETKIDDGYLYVAYRLFRAGVSEKTPA